MPEISHEIGKERELCLLLATGQLTQYGGYDDDGKLRKGKTKQYDILTTGRYAGTTSITLNLKTDVHSNNCVYDKRTRLMWSRYAVGSVGPGSDGKLPWTTNGNGEGIYAFVEAANLSKLALYDDWRIPNDVELPSIREMEQPNGTPDAIAFPGWTTSDYFWVSTTQPNAITNAMIVTFHSGDMRIVAKTSTRFLSLVRGG